MIMDDVKIEPQFYQFVGRNHPICTIALIELQYMISVHQYIVQSPLFQGGGERLYFSTLSVLIIKLPKICQLSNLKKTKCWFQSLENP